jgi:VWFA-related protein
MKKTFTMLFALMATTALGQSLSQKIEVTVVNVDVVVTGPDGQPVHGLTKDDFQIFEDGAAQPITNFYVVEGPALGAPTVKAEAPASAPQIDPRFRRKVLLLIDNSHISKRGRDIALDRIEKFIDQTFETGEYDWSIAAVGAHLGMVMPLTSDKQRIHDVLAAIRSGAARMEHIDQAALRDANSINLGEAGMKTPILAAGVDGSVFLHNQDDVERAMLAKFSMQAVVQAARAFGATEGRKIILFLTANEDFNDLELSYVTHYAMVQRDLISRSSTDDLFAIAKDIKSLKDTIVAEANASNVSFYIINPEGLRASGDLGGQNPSGTTGMTNNQGMYWLARETGGRLMPGNDLAASIQTFETTSSNYYSLGFRPAHDDGKYHKLTVKVTKPGKYDVQHRDGYSTVPADLQIERTLKSPISMASEASMLPVTLTTEKPEPQKERGAMLVPFQAKIPVSKLQFLPNGEKWNAKLDIYVSVFDDRGKNLAFNRFTTSATASSANPDPSGTFTYRNGILLRKGETHRIVVAFRDRATDLTGFAESMVRPE